MPSILSRLTNLFGSGEPGTITKLAQKVSKEENAKAGVFMSGGLVAVAEDIAKAGSAKTAVLSGKDYELLDSAIRDIRSGKFTTQEQKDALKKYQARIDDAVARGVAPSQKDQQTAMNLWEARAYGAYQSIKTQAKDPNSPAIVKDIASKPYQKEMVNPWKDFKGYDADTVLKVYGVRHPEILNDRQKDYFLEKVMREHDAARTAIEKKYGVTVTPFKSPTNAVTPSEEMAITAMNNITKSKQWGPWDAAKKPIQNFKQYPDQPLDSRISRATPLVEDNKVVLDMIVDGKQRTLTISNKNTVEAFHAGALPLNVLANKALEISDKQVMDLTARAEMGLDAQRGQNQNQSMGMRR